MQKTTTKITAIIIAAVMILSLGACADTRHAMLVNGEELRAGVYIYLQLTAAHEASEKFTQDNPDADIFEEGFNFFSQTVDGKSFSDWTNDRALELITEKTAVKLMFDELGFTISSDEELAVRRNVENLWGNTDPLYNNFNHDTWGDFYESIGVGKESLVEVVMYGLMEERVFLGIFGEDGTEPAAQSEINSFFEENFVRYRVIRMETIGLDDIQLREIDAMAADFADRLNAGETYLSLLYEYEDYVTARDHAHDEDIWDRDWDEQLTIEGPDYDEEAVNEEEETDVGGDVPDDPIEETEIVIDPTSFNDFDRLERIGGYSYLHDYGQEFLLTMEMNTAAVHFDENDTYVLQLLPILEREDWILENSEFLLFEMLEDEFANRVSAKANTIPVVLNEAAIKRYKPETAAKRLLQPWL
ncbi:MAG: hypothetical protein FWD48_08040 [Oscillospiraceae bacterium]|nr:hypothetical protein [Oscillospiraceae bacterium]